MNLGLLVEGHGESYAAPILVRRVAAALGAPCSVRSVVRQPRSTIIKAGELERAVTLLGNKVGNDGAVLVLIDADDDLACTLGPALLGRARTARPDLRVGVVLAVREYEAWFLAAATSLRGQRGLQATSKRCLRRRSYVMRRVGWGSGCREATPRPPISRR